MLIYARSVDPSHSYVHHQTYPSEIYAPARGNLGTILKWRLHGSSQKGKLRLCHWSYPTVTRDDRGKNHKCCGCHLSIVPHRCMIDKRPTNSANLHLSPWLSWTCLMRSAQILDCSTLYWHNSEAFLRIPKKLQDIDEEMIYQAPGKCLYMVARNYFPGPAWIRLSKSYLPFQGAMQRW